jgi:hypothetical protein
MSWSSLPDAIVELIVSKLVPADTLPRLALVERRCRTAAGSRLERLRPLTYPPFALDVPTIFDRTRWPDAVTNLHLDNRGINDGATQTLASAVSSGALKSVLRLYLNRNNIGDAGIEALSGALAMGALPCLARLYIGGNQIGDAGLTALARAITPVSAGGSGALASVMVCAAAQLLSFVLALYSQTCAYHFYPLLAVSQPS